MPSGSRNVQRVCVLLSCTFLGLICGTLYLYSSYSPQLAKQLSYTVSDSSLIALCGTVGMAVAGPVSGAVVDKKGYTVSILIGGLLIISGYIGLKYQFDQAWSKLQVSCYWIFSIGLGSTFINSACLKCCAVSFPSIRGVATSLPLALYGLSALFYSVIASTFYPGKTSDFLEFLARSIVIIYVVCFPSVYLADKEHKLKRATSFQSKQRSLSSPDDPEPIHNEQRGYLFMDYKFWLLFLITGFLAALGQMYIYSVGYMVKALVLANSASLDETLLQQSSQSQISHSSQIELVVQQEQQLQVGLISIANCLGRISSGVLGDIITQSFGKPRSWLLVIPAIGTSFCQILSSAVENYARLPGSSFLVGYFYGFTFCLMPIIVGDVFGMENFSFNWGMVSMAPIIPSYYFTSLFGEIYDANSKGDSKLTTTTGSLEASKPAAAQLSVGCFLGNRCYNSIFTLTFSVGLVACVLVVILNVADLMFKKRNRKLLSLSEIRADNFHPEKPK
ncbi:uncharacterized protein LODBEIA_P52230 [Lodderomyces beijingensis]|uniref:Nodulin-like domain-containing protein n=1 Tax=Lodderomyces beijingensis TaxID=1775926 RepID=A0ABP0ZSX9_9ASCO